MPIPLIMPKFEMSQETALVLEWLKKEGDAVKAGDALLSVETDKITIEVEAPADGILQGILVKENEVVPVTTTIAYLLQEGETTADIPKKAEQSDTNTSKVQEAGREPNAIGVKSLSATPIARRMAEAESIDLSLVTGSGKNGEITRADVEEAIQKINVAGGKVRATPAARKLSQTLDVELAQIAGSGPRGRVQRIDVERSGLTGKPQALASGRKKLAGKRKTIAERMLKSYQEVPHIYLTVSADMSAFEKLRSAYNKAGGSHVSLTSLLVFLVARTLNDFPDLNSSLSGDEIVTHAEINIGVATAVQDGLIVPVLKNANVKSLEVISRESGALLEKARSNDLLPADVSGGTVTITNLGLYGVEEFTAIINPGQSAILAVGAMVNTPVAVKDAVAIRPVMKITLGADHRVVDGEYCARFLSALKKEIENPAIVEGE